MIKAQTRLAHNRTWHDSDTTNQTVGTPTNPSPHVQNLS